MKNILFSTVLMFLALTAAAQSPAFGLSHCLVLDTTLIVSEPPDQGVGYNLLSAADDGQLFYTSSFTYASKANNYHGTLYAIDLKTYAKQSFDLPFPDDFQNWQKRAASCVLQSISVSDNDLLMTVSQRLIWYRKKSNIYKLERTMVLPNVVQAYLNGKKTYAFVEDFSRISLSWLRFDSDKDTKGTPIRKWKYKCSFLTQFQPNRYLFVGEDAVFFMPPGERYILKFNPEGLLLDSVVIDFPGWNDFPDELVGTVNACPYGAERIYKALNLGMKNYVFARAFDVLSDSLLLITINMGGENNNPQTVVMRLMKRAAEWNMEFVSMGVADTARPYDDVYYPMYYYGNQEHLLSHPYRGTLFQLLRLPENEQYKGLTPMQYNKRLSESYRYQDPIVKLRVLFPKKPLRFYNYENEVLGLDDFPTDKVLVLVNVQPQCSACQKHLLQLFSSLKSPDVAKAMLFTPTSNYLDRRNIRKDIAGTCQLSYTDLYMIEDVDYGDVLCKRSYPAVLLWERGKGVIGFYDSSTVFTQDLNSYEYSEVFLHAIRTFFE